MKRIAIIAALPGELGPLVAGWERAYPWKSQPSRARAVFRHCRLWQRRRGDTELIAVCAGAGLRAARHAFTAAELLGPLDAAISVGWAGALQAGFQAGRAYHVSGLIDAQTGEVFHTAGEAGQAWLATSHQVAGHAQKQQLAQTYHAELVDMEGVAIARLTAAHNIPFYCVKGVSDALADCGAVRCGAVRCGAVRCGAVPGCCGVP